MKNNSNQNRSMPSTPFNWKTYIGSVALVGLSAGIGLASYFFRIQVSTIKAEVKQEIMVEAADTYARKDLTEYKLSIIDATTKRIEKDTETIKSRIDLLVRKEP